HQSPRPSIVQLPVLYYPGLLEVRAEGKSLPYGSLDGYLAVRVPRGTHRIEARFVGLRWANRVSALAWTLVVCGLIASGAAAGRGRAAAWGRGYASLHSRVRAAYPRRRAA